MPSPLSRRDLLKATAGCVAAWPVTASNADAHGLRTPPGWVAGHLTGAEALVETLIAEGATCVFGIPGAQENELWDAMKSKRLGYLLVTHEFSAAAMADGYARSTGQPGVLCVVPGPGVTNSLSGIGEALLDSVPLVCIVGDVARGKHYKPFQVHELPNADLLRPVCKQVFEVQHAIDIPQAVRHAFQIARHGEPGPVAVVVPYTHLLEKHHYQSAPLDHPGVPFDEAACQRALALLANRRLKIGIYAGLGCMDCSPMLVKTAELLQAPVATSVAGKGAIPEDHPLAVGWGYGAQGTRTAEQAFKSVDLVLAIGVKYSEVSTAFYSIPRHRHHIHVDINPNNLGRIVPADVCVNADAELFMARLNEQAASLERPHDGKLAGRIARLKADDRHEHAKCYNRGGIDPLALILALRRLACDDAQVFVDVTLAEHLAAEAFTTTRPRSYFNPTNNQSMGWSIPAALGAQRAHPGRQTITITGDGCFLMSAMEISTAAREGLPVKFFILDDQAYHYMQALQRSAYLRTTATILARLDYAALAQGFGVSYQEIAHPAELDPAIRGALQDPGPVLTRVVTDYGDRKVRWVEAVKDRFTDELSPPQKLRFLARVGSRALDFRREND